jgi:hypothetical protein
LSRDAGFPTGDIVEIELKRITEKTNNPKPIQTALKRRKPTTKQRAIRMRQINELIHTRKKRSSTHSEISRMIQPPERNEASSKKPKSCCVHK